MNFSKILATLDKIEIGLLLLQSVFHPALCIGVIIAVFKIVLEYDRVGRRVEYNCE